MRKSLRAAAFISALMISACASAPPIQTEPYAQLKNHRVFETDMPVVWHAVEEVFRNSKVTDRDPKEASDLEMRTLKERMLRTDWSYTKSNDKHEDYRVNDSVRTIYLQERNRYRVLASRVLGGVDVTVTTDEEVESINSDGSSGGFHAVDKPDPARASEILNRINQAILAAPPTGAAP